MTIVYIDSLFLLNLVLDYLLLLASAKVAGEVLHRARMAAGAALGALYAALTFLPGLTFLSHPLCKLCAAALMLLTAFGTSRRLLRLSLVFFGVSAAFGGGVFALQLLGAQGIGISGGVAYSPLDLRVILLSAAGCYCVLTLVFRRMAVHGGPRRDLLPAVLSLDARRVELTTLVDTGNTLSDPASGRPVMVAEGAHLMTLLPEPLSADDLQNPVRTMQHLHNPKRFRLLPYRAVGVDCGMLLAVRVDTARVGNLDYGSILVALSPTPVSDAGGYQALIGAQY